MSFRRSLITAALISMPFLWQLFTGNISRPISRWDEQTNIDVVTQSASEKNPLLLRYENRPFFEKPPLWYWINEGAANMYRDSLIHTTRYTSISAGFISLLVTMFLAVSYAGIIPSLIAAVFLYTSRQLFTVNAGGYFSSHTLASADLDSMHIMFIMISFAFASAKNQSYMTAVGTGLSSGLAVLTKGPLGFVVPFIYALIPPKPKKFRGIRQTTLPLFISVATVLPWYLFMIAVYRGTFVQSHISYHMVSRFVTPIEGHADSVWFYLSILTNPNIVPLWIIPAISSAFILRNTRLFTDIFAARSLIISALFIIIPTLMKTKLAWYILPAYSFLALLTAIGVREIFRYFSVKTV